MILTITTLGENQFAQQENSILEPETLICFTTGSNLASQPFIDPSRLSVRFRTADTIAHLFQQCRQWFSDHNGNLSVPLSRIWPSTSFSTRFFNESEQESENGETDDISAALDHIPNKRYSSLEPSAEQTIQPGFVSTTKESVTRLVNTQSTPSSLPVRQDRVYLRHLVDLVGILPVRTYSVYMAWPFSLFTNIRSREKVK
ncbi:unnamed protein product [Protopolystoma xenopodis]|uniref:Uncharacterized protein n=1 Tax=Protopolystoma xenopodis TaxID=117903 RepID=A0A448XMB6_9PLAT|nr:unnamed protein product [Protopolystoma xenopodis]